MSSVLVSTVGIFLFGGLVQGITGFGAALVLVPMLCLVIDIKQAVLLTILNAFVMLTYQITKLRNHVSLPKLLPLILGGLPGIIVGVFFLKYVDADKVKFLLGSVLISYSIYSILIKPKTIEPSAIWGYISGFFSGLLTSSIGAGGLPVVIYSALTNWSKDEIKATMVGYFFLTVLVTIIAYLLLGLIDTGTGILKLFGWSIPSSLLGAGIGMSISSRINREMYLLLVNYLLAVLGIMMFLQ